MFLELLSFIFGKIIFFCGSIVGDSFPKPLTLEEETECLEKFRKYGDESAKDKLIRHNLRLVAHVVKKYQGADETDDLISAGTIGLIKAINSYNIDKGTALATYTAKCIENEILMLLRQNKKNAHVLSLSGVVGTDKDGNELTLMDLIPDDSEELSQRIEKKTENKKLIEIVESTLKGRELTVIKLRYGLSGGVPLAQREVAKLLKISRSYISRIEKKAIEKIREEMKKRGAYFD
ncbi:MAG: sigma-70 family RNA polymerase sigma factor [Clostridiales bacterium]|nr:sigma-70 family RNA polymerase sigma factor [Clostridiales bacterium]